MPFTESFEGREDKELAQKLEKELPGILNWALAGCRSWQQDGLASSPEIEAATQAYRDEMDVLGDFLDERCVVAAGAMVTKRDLYLAYVDWAENSSEQPLRKINFGKTLVHRVEGLVDHRTGGGTRCWSGIGLKNGPAPASEPEEENVPYDV